MLTFQDVAAWQREWLLPAQDTATTLLDTVFYDVAALTRQEQDDLLARQTPEGAVVVVHPAERAEAIQYLTPLAFIEGHQNGSVPMVTSVVVAGVGSSALGTAALARNLADVIKQPVAGIVSGQGLADVVSEAMGGALVFGVKNSLREIWARWFDLLDMKDHVWDAASYHSMVKQQDLIDLDMGSFLYGAQDSTALLLVLYHLRDRVSLLLGHSKGNYVIENALEGLITLCRIKQQPVPTGVRILTFGAVVGFPPEFHNVKQYLGTGDVLGMLNSRWFEPREWVVGASHSTASGQIGALSLGDLLGDEGGDLLPGQPAA